MDRIAQFSQYLELQPSDLLTILDLPTIDVIRSAEKDYRISHFGQTFLAVHNDLPYNLQFSIHHQISQCLDQLGEGNELQLVPELSQRTNWVVRDHQTTETNILTNDTQAIRIDFLRDQIAKTENSLFYLFLRKLADEFLSISLIDQRVSALESPLDWLGRFEQGYQSTFQFLEFTKAEDSDDENLRNTQPMRLIQTRVTISLTKRRILFYTYEMGSKTANFVKADLFYSDTKKSQTNQPSSSTTTTSTTQSPTFD